jgi:beta-lactamase superfamily II metal-dependent hydrolase
MEIKFYQAECGDAARIRFLGDDQKYHNIIIDSGYERTFRHILAEEIRKIEMLGEAIDLWVISHVHDDHIGGVVKYIKSISDGETKDIVLSWFYNVPRDQKSPAVTRISPTSEAKSISQGDTVLNFLLKKRVPIQDVTNNTNIKELYGLRIIILSPDTTTLSKLRLKYSKTEIEKNEMDSISFAKAAPQYDYHIPVDKFDLKDWNEDESIENRSSISLITEYKNQRVLWLADAHPSIIVEKLNELGYSQSNPIVCDWVKVSHHGSKGNNSGALYEIISCENYLISSNGENIHCLPTKECIVRILKNPNRKLGSHYRFVFTYDNQLLQSIFKADTPDIFERLNFSLHYPEKEVRAIIIS